MAHSTKEFFPAFQDEARKWVSRFGLIGWQLEVLCQNQEEQPDVGDAKAICRAIQRGRVAQIILNAEWPEWVTPTEFDVRRSAFHECCELLLMRLEWLAFDRNTTQESFEEERHIVIRTLENAVFHHEHTEKESHHGCKHW